MYKAQARAEVIEEMVEALGSGEGAVSPGVVLVGRSGPIRGRGDGDDRDGPTARPLPLQAGTRPGGRFMRRMNPWR